MPTVTYIVLLRGVNVGKANRVPMAAWRELLEGLGYGGVATLLNSGNAVFRSATGTAAKHAATIAAAMKQDMKVDVPVIVKSSEELSAVVAENPLKKRAPEAKRFLVAFTQDGKALAGLAEVAKLVVAPEKFSVGKHAAYLYCANGILESKAGVALLGKAGKAATTRNWATVSKLEALATSSGAKP